MTRREFREPVKAEIRERSGGLCMEAAIEKYMGGASIRSASEGMPFSREPLRQELVRRGLIRGRLEYHRDPLERVLSYVQKSDGCWLWAGVVNNKGYGVSSFNGKATSAHRVVYALLESPVPKGMDLCHKCDNPLCVRPDHMFVGTRRDNMRDAARKGRTSRGSRVPSAVLNESMVREAKARAADGEPIKQIAADLSAPYRVLWAAVRGKTWRHV